MCMAKINRQNIKQIEEIIEKHLAMINKITSSEIPQKIVYKEFIGVL